MGPVVDCLRHALPGAWNLLGNTEFPGRRVIGLPVQHYLTLVA